MVLPYLKKKTDKHNSNDIHPFFETIFNLIPNHTQPMLRKCMVPKANNVKVH